MSASIDAAARTSLLLAERSLYEAMIAKDFPTL